jgi:orotidine-5'-phosphate decarboxylase
VLGLDPDPSRLWSEAAEQAAVTPAGSLAERAASALADSGAERAAAPPAGSAVERAAAAVAAHCAAVIEAAGPACVAVKPQLACFERLGAPGWAALAQTVEAAHAAGLLVLADGKRGDIDVSARAYGQALVGTTDTPFGAVAGLGADAFTANPYMGVDTVRALVDVAREARAGTFVLVRTSNPGAADVEDLELAGGGTVWERVAVLVAAIGDEGDTAELADVGAVVGATAPAHLARMRELMPRTPFLLPGVGAQGGRVEDLAPAFLPGRAGGLVTASRSIVNAHDRTGASPSAAARAEAERLRAAAWSLAD